MNLLDCVARELAMHKLSFVAVTATAVAEAQSLPDWTPTYKMSESTTIMPCNFSGYCARACRPPLLGAARDLTLPSRVLSPQTISTCTPLSPNSGSSTTIGATRSSVG